MSPSQYEILSREIAETKEMVATMIKGQKYFNDVFMPALKLSMEDIHKNSPCRQEEAIIDINKRLDLIEKYIGLTD